MKKILLIETDREHVERITEGLAPLYDLEVLTEANIVVEMAEHVRPALVLLRVELPDTNGWLICNRLKRNQELRDIPVVLMSSEATEEVFAQHRLLKTRAEEYVHVPFQLATLTEKIGWLIEGAPHPSPDPFEEVTTGEIEHVVFDMPDSCDEVVAELDVETDLTVVSAAIPEPGWFSDEMESAAGRLVMLYGASKGAVYPVGTSGLRIGRDAEQDVSIPHPSVSRAHCAILVSPDSHPGQVVLVDRGSTNGTYLNTVRIDGQPLEDGDLIHVGVNLFKYYSADNFEAYLSRDASRKLSLDSVTDFESYAHFRMKMQREARRCRRFGRLLSLIMLRIDAFTDIRKHVIETLGVRGLVFGDKTIIEIAGLLRSLLGEEDTEHELGRWNDCFGVLLPEIGSMRAKRIAETIRRAVESHRFEFDGQAPQVTVSCAVATRGGKSLVADEAIDEGSMPVLGTASLESLCLDALVKASDAGGNRVLSIDEARAAAGLARDSSEIDAGIQTIPLRWLKASISRALRERATQVEVGTTSLQTPQRSVIHGQEESLLVCERELLNALGRQGIHLFSEVREGVYAYFRPCSVEWTMASVQTVVSREYRDAIARLGNAGRSCMGLVHGCAGPFTEETPVDLMVADALAAISNIDS
jgi:diguanylate cyclase (GGDEF)-like protein